MLKTSQYLHFYYIIAHSFTVTTILRADKRVWNLILWVFICIYSANLTQGLKKNNNNKQNAKQTEANTSILVRWRRMEKERDIGLQQIAVYRNKFTWFVCSCITLFQKSPGGFGGGEESSQKIACRRMNL